MPEDNTNFERYKDAAHSEGWERQAFDFDSLERELSAGEIEELKRAWKLARSQRAVYEEGQQGKEFSPPSVENDFSTKEITALKKMHERGKKKPLDDEDIFESDTYELGYRIGNGAFGRVYKGRDINLGRPVAIKIQKSVRGKMSHEEAKLLAQVRSPYVVQIHYVGKMKDKRIYLVMEWIEGKPLSGHIKPSEPLAEYKVHKWMRQCCQGMIDVSRFSIVHRDLKPSNILVDSETNEVRICDFGLAKQTSTGISSEVESSAEADAEAAIEAKSHGSDANNTRGGSTFSIPGGTPLYMAPEHWEGKTSTRSDIYSFGATFYHLLTKQPPFSGQNDADIRQQHEKGILEAPVSRNPELSDPMNDILERCLAKNPNNRFGSFVEVLQQLTNMWGLREPGETGTIEPWDQVALELGHHIERYKEMRDNYLDCYFPDEAAKRYDLESGRSIIFECGNIANSDAQALVSSDDSYLTMGAGVSRAIRDAAGEEIENEVQKFVPVMPGRVAVTSAGKLKQARFIFHAITIEKKRVSLGLSTVKRPSRDIILQILDSCFREADSYHIETIAFPLLGTGSGRLESGICLDAMMQYLVNKLGSGSTSVSKARIVLWPGT